MTFAPNRYLLKLFCKPQSAVPANQDEAEWSIDTALNTLRKVDPDLEQRIRGKTIVDFGSGLGYQSAALLRAGAAKVLGLESLPERVEAAKRLLFDLGMSDRAEFRSSVKEVPESTFDLVISQNSMEHYPDPARVLQQMRALLKPGGLALVTFGPPWFAPYGAHMRFFTSLPWVHLFFTEKTILSVRADYRDDGATRYEDVPGGLNRMTIAKFESLIAQSGFELISKRYDCVKNLNFLAAIPFVREFFVNHVTVLLTKRASENP